MRPDQEKRITVVIPNYNGIKYIENCLRSVLAQTEPCEVIVVDNGSTDGSLQRIREAFPTVRVMELGANTGFCHACNTGIHVTRTEFVMLLNDDTTMEPDCIEKLRAAIERRPYAFSVQAKMLRMHCEEGQPQQIDGAGDLYCAMGWAFARGKGKSAQKYRKPCGIFSSCAGAALYRRSVFDVIGYLDERHFCYLEDVDLGFRAQRFGFRNYYEPEAVVYHAGSASSGGTYSAFKEVLTAGNNYYLLYKNLPGVQYALNVPLIQLGIAIKRKYFNGKGLGEAYEKGLDRGKMLVERAKAADAAARYGLPAAGDPIPEEACYEVTDERTQHVLPLYLGGKVHTGPAGFFHCVRIQGLLWLGLIQRLFV
ncbi:MAG: glycosyltransferase family 2 protein [Lachnospiraceae bacterium]|nr:glycosyltransferase family 2 protein [Lachnospiraceae bacterium]